MNIQPMGVKTQTNSHNNKQNVSFGYCSISKNLNEEVISKHLAKINNEMDYHLTPDSIKSMVDKLLANIEKIRTQYKKNRIVDIQIWHHAKEGIWASVKPNKKIEDKIRFMPEVINQRVDSYGNELVEEVNKHANSINKAYEEYQHNKANEMPTVELTAALKAEIKKIDQKS